MSSESGPRATLSKSKIKLNNQCSKLLYFEIYHKDLKEISSKDTKVFKVGREVEKNGRDMFPEGNLVSSFKNEEKVIETKKLLKHHPEKVIFEASFFSDLVLIQVDILLPLPDGSYKAIEIKSSSKKKPEFIEDIAIQLRTINSDGQIKISSYELWTVNTKSISSETFFNKIEVLEEAKELLPAVEEMITNSKNTLNLTEAPNVKIGKHCKKPYDCPFRNQCWKNEDSKNNSVLKLPNFEKKWELHSQGIETVDHKDFPSELYPSKEILEAVKENRLYINSVGILKELQKWKAPFHFFDFESLMSHKPIFENTRPYQQVPIQYSLHSIQNLKQIKNFKHKEFLHDNYQSPNKVLVQRIIEDLGSDDGTIVGYHSQYEITRIKDLAKECDQETQIKLQKICDRFVDLKEVIKEYLYHPDFKDSYSLKVVSPVILGDEGSYENSFIKSGSEVSDIFLEYLECSCPVRKNELKSHLLTYCGIDTLNLILLTQKIISLSEEELFTQLMKAS